MDNEQELKLNEAVARYGEMDAKIKELKKAAEIDKEYISNALEYSDLQKWTSGGFAVQRVVSTRETFDECALLDLLKEEWLTNHADINDCPYIKTKEYVDMDALETALYAQDIPIATVKEMEMCKETKKIVAIRCKKVSK